MEFPKLGNNCSEKTCKKLDFLPIKCDCCGNIFCNDHYKYTAHHCSAAHKNNVQVPECPLCGVPVPIPRGQQPDVAVGAHIDRDCKWDPSKDRKVFTNKCTMKGCKVKEIIPVLCSECKSNFCLRHRHTADHDCPGSRVTARTKMGIAATKRNQGSISSNKSYPRNAQEQYEAMSEDEALARALALSLQDNEMDLNNRDKNDEQLNRALAESIKHPGGSLYSQGKDKCSLS